MSQVDQSSQKAYPIARQGQTDTKTDTKVDTEDTLSGFQFFFLQPISLTTLNCA